MSTEVVLNYKEKRQVAQSWNELDFGVLKKVVRAFFAKDEALNVSDEVTMTKILVSLALLDLPLSYLKKWAKDTRSMNVFYEELLSILDISNPFFKVVEQEDGTKIFTSNPALTSCKNIDGFSVGFREYYGVGDLLANMTYDEFMIVENKFASYSKLRDEQTLNEICGILFRPRQFFKDELVAFHENMVAKRGRKFKGINPLIKLIILHYYISCRDNLTTYFNKLFGVKEHENRSSSSQWFEIKFHIAGTKFGSFEEVGKMKIIVILKHLQMIAIENEELRQKMLYQNARLTQR